MPTTTTTNYATTTTTTLPLPPMSDGLPQALTLTLAHSYSTDTHS